MENLNIEPNSNKSGVFKPRQDSAIINIVNDYDWTISSQGSTRKNVPRVYLVESYLEYNSFIASLLYMARQAPSAIVDSASDFVQTVGQSAGVDGLVSKVQKAAAAIQSFTDTLTPGYSARPSPELAPYVGLYLTKPTGFKYVLPYYSDDAFKQEASWQETQQIKAFGVAQETATRGLVEQVAATINILNPNTYIEKPKYYQYEGEETVRVQFPLFNTNTEDAYEKNYKFLWLLIHQNLPNRTNAFNVVPPKVYELQIPGYKYFMFSTINRITVTFQGARRKMNVETPRSGSVNAIIPDAYMVDIEFRSLLPTSANFLQESSTDRVIVQT